MEFLLEFFLAFFEPVFTLVLYVLLRPFLLMLSSPFVWVLANLGTGTYWENVCNGYGRVLDFAEAIREHL
jgi:hypothetical protein